MIKIVKTATGPTSLGQLAKLFKSLACMPEPGDEAELLVETVASVTLTTRDGLQLKVEQSNSGADFEVSATWEIVREGQDGQKEHWLNHQLLNYLGVEPRYQPDEAKLVRALSPEGKDPFRYQSRLLAK